jgi:hypothetical protein
VQLLKGRQGAAAALLRTWLCDRGGRHSRIGHGLRGGAAGRAERRAAAAARAARDGRRLLPGRQRLRALRDLDAAVGLQDCLRATAHPFRHMHIWQYPFDGRHSLQT